MTCDRRIGLSFLALCLGATGLSAGESYLESHGAEYIDLGYCSRPENKVVIDFCYTASANQQLIFGNDFDSGYAGSITGHDQLSFSSYQNGSGCYAFCGQDGQGAWQTFNGNAGYSKIVAYERRILTLDLPNKNGTLTDPDGTFTYNTTMSGKRTQTNEYSMLVFAGRRPGTNRSSIKANARIYSFKLYEGGELIRYLVPYSDGNENALRDVLSGTVYRNQGAGSFSIGGDIGCCSGYSADELSGKTLATGYQLVNGQLVDLSIPGLRKNGEQLEFRVRASIPCGSVTMNGTTGTSVEKWFAYGSEAAINLSVTAAAGRPFSSWAGSTTVLADGDLTSASVSFTAAGPIDLVAKCPTADDIYSEATVWLRGPYDMNGNGRVDSGEAISAIGERSPWTSMTVCNEAIVSNEWVAMPYRGGKRLLPTLYFPQRFTITNEELGVGRAWPSTVKLNGFTPKAKVTSEDYSFVIRFRPDNSQFRTDNIWMFGWGYNNKDAGFLLGLTHGAMLTNKFAVSKAVTNEVPYRPYGLTLFKSGQTAGVFNFGSVVYGGVWHDLAVSFDGTHRKIRAVLSRAAWDPDLFPSSESTMSDKGGQNVWSNEVAMTDGTVFTPTSGLIFGSESAISGEICQTNGVHGSNINYTKCFRGSIQQFATWNRALSFDEMKDALAGPRPDLMRVGVRDGLADELRGGDGCEQDDLEWTVPSTLAAGESATVRFVGEKLGEEELTEMLRAYPTGRSSAGRLRAVLNGTDLGIRSVNPGAKTEWRVAPNVLASVSSTLAGSTNELVLTRTDTGADPMEFDALALGGSIQMGQKNGTYFEFVHESHSVPVHEVLNANTYDVRRVYFGGIPNSEGKKSSATNQVFSFKIPVEFRGSGYGWTLEWKDLCTCTYHLPRWRLNGHELGYTASADSKYHTLEIPDEWLTDGANRLDFYNAGTYKSGDYYSLDYWRLRIKPRTGMVIMIR